MSIKEFFSKKDVPNNNGESNFKNMDFPGNNAMDFAQNTVVQMLELDKQGLLSRSIEDYIASEAFLRLLSEFPVKAAVRIFDAEEKAAHAQEHGKQLVIDDIYRRKALPKSIKNTQSAVPEDDYGKMTSEEFNRIKERLAAQTRR